MTSTLTVRDALARDTVTRHLRARVLSVAFALGALGAGDVVAQSTPPDLQPAPEPPPIPDRVRSGEVLEPDVRIVRKDQSTVTEYRLNGQLRAIKVQPDGDFPPYYLYDTDGDGRLDRRVARFDPDLLIPSWVIFSW